ncbi:DNA-3-methyladenine glycosylase [Streptomyces tateyamensis]|uniref:Putative 3-methyladenine DNA glycosylase n=1 Tax=Streptomyces tateyamensis TaxID=565073 RepID=A0A2V4N8P5_9ACTN|nr:DNA-3-methyladenine glycosylase [Streptomyces tateyamensis]PYC74568.1 DNA-3-methyladenine glycosylase [Streptomyces tateyamensis]
MTEDPAAALDRAFFDRPSPEVAPDLLGRLLRCTLPTGTVELRLTEVEAYTGPDDPASHAYRGRTARNAVMFGPPGHAYVYFTYGMHFCLNLVCGPALHPGGVLLRAGRVTEGIDSARRRRPGSRRDHDLAQGPARLTVALGVDRTQDGEDVVAGPVFRLLPGTPPAPGQIRTGPRTGVAAAADTPWRFWIEGDPTVSPYRAHAPRRRAAK